ncbi:sporulation integral membrane protein YlbJ|uniref:Sporulation integral membrane protein YlbJ n=1 Tax=Dendrosporobacter quercicolus TaxID=146817 RepID=A0A1G9L7T7_9FIRM|nr:sporulation integral membrane protein YlbJ [Dendrosporobacter quercicolus]NSL46624.1 sporulation integral membrane protein YlbJ [Dendrosporobacter quercicolus DSM 1736]SDL57803.1 sporulation integral membrane protein YlbJ [Dendrosporobacter quercicolus]
MMIWSRGRRYQSRLQTYLLALGTVFITIAMVEYPKDAFDSAIVGLNLWWTVVFPALLPFFILSEILMGIGVVHFIGVLLEPLMRPVFNVPGVGAFAMSMGLASGYPMDAVITCKFRKNQLCSAVEAERLLSFTNTADPLFMFGAVAVGMFGMPELGATIAIAHYLASLLVGVIFRFHGRSRDMHPVKKATVPAGNIVGRAFEAMLEARQEDKRSFGQLLGDSVKSSMNTILLIGGFIILFSVFLRILSVVGITDHLNAVFAGLLSLLGLSASLAPALVSGLFEIDLGALAASQANAPLIEKVTIASAIIAWSGLSVHGQVASIVIESGIRMAPYMVARVLHATLAAILTMWLMAAGQPMTKLFVAPAMINIGNTNSIAFWGARLEQAGYQLLLLLSLLVSISVTLHMIKGLYLYVKR